MPRKDPFAVAATIRESKVEKSICEFAEYHGWMQFKVTSPAFNGMPDRGFVRKTGDKSEFILAEIKQFGKKPEPLQRVRARELAKHGVEVHWFDNLEDAKNVFRR